MFQKIVMLVVISVIKVVLDELTMLMSNYLKKCYA
jgi:hypothetical protein